MERELLTLPERVTRSLVYIKALNVPWTLKQSVHKGSSQSLQYLTATEDFVALKQGSQSCDEEAISFLKLNAKV